MKGTAQTVLSPRRRAVVLRLHGNALPIVTVTLLSFHSLPTLLWETV